MRGLGQNHKHLPEMQVICGLTQPPMFSPMICDYYSGMLVNIPFRGISAKEIHSVFLEHYSEAENVKIAELLSQQSQTSLFLAGNELSGTDIIELNVFGNDQQALVSARLDNLGKGASGAAVQCLDLMLKA